MRRSFALICLFLTASGCSASNSRNVGAEGGPTLVTPLMLEPPPVYSLIGFRDRLELTPVQISSIDSIASHVHDQNSPLIDQIREEARPTRSQIGLVIPEELRSTLDAVRANNRDAARAVGEVLTATQQTSACAIFEEQREDEDRNGRQRRSSRLGSEADSILASARRSVWPWCSNRPAI